MAKVHFECWRSLGQSVVFFDPLDATEIVGVPRATSLADLLDQVDIADVCLPTDLHAEFAAIALGAGKPTFLEKPIALTLAEAGGLHSRALTAGVPFAVGHVVRLFPEYQAAHRVVVDGQLGRPAAVRLRRAGSFPTGVQNWFRDPKRSGGVLMDLAIHDFDWLRWTFGEVQFLTSKLTRLPVGEYALTTLTFRSGLVAHVESSWMEPAGFHTAFEVCGSDGMLEFDSRSSAPFKSVHASGTSFEHVYSPEVEPYRRQLARFLAAVESGGEVDVDAADAIASLKISLAAIESAETGDVVHL